jgi:hypothetical protein
MLVADRCKYDPFVLCEASLVGRRRPIKAQQSVAQVATSQRLIESAEVSTEGLDLDQYTGR